jgi:hypothetical protein
MPAGCALLKLATGSQLCKMIMIKRNKENIARMRGVLRLILFLGKSDLVGVLKRKKETIYKKLRLLFNAVLTTGLYSAFYF